MCGVINNKALEYISKLYTQPLSRYSSSRNCHLSLPRPRIDILFKTSIAFSGVFLWNKLRLTATSCYSLSSFKRRLRVHPEAVKQDGLWQKTCWQERDRRIDRQREMCPLPLRICLMRNELFRTRILSILGHLIPLTALVDIHWCYY